MTWRDHLLAALARQLGRPEGPLGLLVGRRLNARNRPMVEAVVAAAQALPGGQVADLGFGGGVGLRLLLDRVGPEGRVHGVDLSTTMVRAARRKYRHEIEAGRLALREGSLTDLPLEDSSLDAAITVNTVYFIDDLRALSSELARVLRPGGRAVLGIGDPVAMASISVTDHGFRLRPVSDVEHRLRDAGLTELHHGRVGDDDAAAHLLVWQRPA